MKTLLFFTTAANHESPNAHSYDWIDASDVAAAKLELCRKHDYQIKNIYTEAEYKEAGQ
jgi:hypothetical protein